MATVNANGLGPNDIYDMFTGPLLVQAATPTQFTLSNSKATLIVTGTDFTYDTNTITGGTITRAIETLNDGSGAQVWTGLNTSAVTAFNALATANITAFQAAFFSGDDVFNYNYAPTKHTAILRTYGGNDTVNFNYNTFAMPPSEGGIGIKTPEIDGGDGFDTLNLTTGFTAPATVTAGPPSFHGVRNFEAINLSAGYDYAIAADIDIANSGALTVNGSALGPSNSLKFTTSAHDTSRVGGRLILVGGAGNDYFMGGAANDVFNGGAGSDTVSFLGDPTPGFTPKGVGVDLNISTIQSIGGGWGSDIFVSIENVTGTSYSDVLIGNEGDNILNGGSRGNDVLDGRGGFDTAVFSEIPNAVITRTSVGHYTVFWAGTGNTTTLSNIEQIQFSNSTRTLMGLTRQSNDFDGDKRGDLLLQYNDGTLAIWLTDKFSFAGAGIVGSPGAAWHARDTADYDNDGKADILMQHDDSSIAVWLVNDTSFAGGAQIGVTPGPAWKVKASGDFDGDGKADIILQHDDSQIAVWKVRDLSFAGGDLVGTAPGTAWKVKDAGDFDGDGKSDMVMQRDTGEIAIWKLDGLTFAGAGIAGSPGAGWHVKAAADFNGDGKADLLLQHDDSSVAVWLMNGTSMAGAGLVATPGAAWHVKGASDYNGDGKADIVLQRDSGEIAVWQMSGVSMIDAGTVGNPGNLWGLVGPG